MTQDEFLRGLAKGLSGDRLLKYRQKTMDRSEQVAYYVWNTALCESFYPALHAFEIALRNRIHEGLAVKHNAYWYEARDFLDIDEVRELDNVKKVLEKHGKPVTPPYVISELHLGFCCALFARRYERKIWPGGVAWFQGMRAPDRTREKLSARVERIRRIRNRVFHFEPIFHYTDLNSEYDYIVETTGYINPQVMELIRLFGDFKQVNASGIDPYLDRVREYLGALESLPEEG